MKKENCIPVIGKERPYRGKEDFLQMNLTTWIKLMYKDALFFHVPNGGKRNAIEAAKFKRMGVLAGVSDLILLEPRQGYSGLIIELKTKYKGKYGVVADSQEKFLIKASRRNFKVAVCYSFEAAKDLINDYFSK